MKKLLIPYLKKIILSLLLMMVSADYVLGQTTIKTSGYIAVKLGEKMSTRVSALSTEFDPHFLSQNVTRNDGAKAEDWNRIILKRIKEMKLQKIRVMVLPQWYEPQNDNDDPNVIDWNKFTFDSNEMQSLYKELDMAQELNIQVNLTLWGAPLNHFLAGDNTGDWAVAPADYQEWSENFSALVQYLLYKKHYTCVKEITPVNEPDWAYLIKGKVAPASEYVKMCRVLDERFKKDGIRNKVLFSLSDNSDGGTGTHKYLEACTRELSDVADIFNSHTYIFGYKTPNSTILDWENQNYQLSRSAGKPHFVGEFGGNECVGSSRQKDINRYERGVLMSRITIDLLNAGASGVSYWSLIDQYYNRDANYESMQQLGLWKYVKNAYASDSSYQNIQCDYEVRPQYYAYSLLTRFVRSGAEVYPVEIPEEFCAGTAIKNMNGKWTYIFANAVDTEKKINLFNRYVRKGSTYRIYKYVQTALPKGDSQILREPNNLKVMHSLSYALPANSVVVITEE